MNIKKSVSSLSSVLLILLFVLSSFLWVKTVDAQTSPLSLPLFDPTQIKYLGEFNITADPYGGAAVGVSEDGNYLYTSCWGTGPSYMKGFISKSQIPQIGGSGAMVQPCQAGVTNSELVEITGDPSAYFPVLGSILENNGRFVVGGFVTYDATGASAPRKTFWSGTSLGNLVGPYEGSVRNGLVKGQSGIIPPVWRSLLGGDSYVGAGYSSIVSRSSYGPAFTSFNIADVTKDGFQMNFLLGCPYYEPGTNNYLSKCVSRYGSPQSLIDYNGSEQSGGSFFVPGTRTLVVIEREALGPTCYGYATRVQADHGKPYLDAVYCYSLSDAQNQKGPLGYPYQLVAKLYDLKDLVDVKNGVKKAWDVNPYSVVNMPNNDSTPENERIGYTGGGVFNPVRGEYYLTREFNEPVDVFGGFTSGSGSIGADTAAPSVSISSPINGSTVSGGGVSISASASDNVSVSGVQFKIDGVNLGSEDTTSPYSINWDTLNYSNGSHTVTAVARDSSGNTATASGVSVSVSNTSVVAPTADIKANGSDGPLSVPATSGVTLTWTSTNATSCSVAPGSYTGLTGTQSTLAIEAGRTFTVTCTGAGGAKTDSVVVSPSVVTTTDTTKPTVNITAPSSYTAIKGVPIVITADATDNVGVVGVQFQIDGVNFGTEDTTAPYSTIWDTTNATEGAHTLTAVARDAAGNTQTSASVTVTIPSADTADTTKPTVSITAPSSNSTVSGSVTLSANATDNVGVTGVQFKLNGVNLLTEDSTAPYSLTWNTDSVSDGSYTLAAVARDAAGNTQTSSSVNVTVANGVDDEPVVPPSVLITAPSTGSTLTSTVTVSASAEDNVGVSGVQFKLDGVNLLPEDTTAPYSISWDTKTTTNGIHTLTAVAKDVEGNQTTSSSVSVSVSNTTEVPTALKIGDKVRTTAWVNVRSTAGGRWVGTQRTGKTGTITTGPGYANNLTWWKVNFTSGADGWVAANYLAKSTVAMTEDDYRQNIANIYLLIKYLQDRVAGQN